MIRHEKLRMLASLMVLISMLVSGLMMGELPVLAVMSDQDVLGDAATVSGLEVLRDNDTLRAKWMVTEASNLGGFDLFASETAEGLNRVQVTEVRIAPQDAELLPHEYYYQADRPDLSAMRFFFLRVYDTAGNWADVGPVEAVVSAGVVLPLPVTPEPPAPPTLEPILRTEPPAKAAERELIQERHPIEQPEYLMMPEQQKPSFIPLVPRQRGIQEPPVRRGLVF